MNLRFRSFALLTLSILAPAVCRGAEILAEVPNDALGFVLVHKLSAFDTKVGQIGALLERPVPQPLKFLKEFAGISEGLNADGDFLLAFVPAGEGGEGSLQFCVWLPVADYDRFLASINASSIDGVAAATIAGEDLLVARRGDWAIVMDPDQRDRIAEMASASPSPPELPAWQKWIDGNDVTIVAFAPGVRTIVGMIEDESGVAGTANQDSGRPGRTPSGYRRAAQPRLVRSFTDILENLKLAFNKWNAAAPEFMDLIQQANIVGCGLRVDASGNALTSVRVALSKELTDELMGEQTASSRELPFAMSEGVGSVLNGAGRMPAYLWSVYAKAYARYVATELRDEERTQLDETSFTRLLDAVEASATDVRSVAVLSQPGDELEPVYTNEFVAIRVDSSATAIEHAKEVMRLWNSANREARGDTKLVFDVEETKLGERPATLYSLDMTALEGGAIVPEVRQAMEKMFGPGGKMKVWLVPTDEHTLLLAAATQDQVTEVLKIMDKKRAIDWNVGAVREINTLLPGESDWKLFLDGHRYFEWQGREKAAIVGVPVIGGPLVKDFPASPPIGLAGGFRDGDMWIEVAVMAPTLKSADTFLGRNRSRAAIQLRGRVLGPPPVPVPAPAPGPMPK